MRIAVKFAEGTLEENIAKVRQELPESAVALENAKRNMAAFTVIGDIDVVRTAIQKVCPEAQVKDESVPNYSPDVPEEAA